VSNERRTFIPRASGQFDLFATEDTEARVLSSQSNSSVNSDWALRDLCAKRNFAGGTKLYHHPFPQSWRDFNGTAGWNLRKGDVSPWHARGEEFSFGFNVHVQNPLFSRSRRFDFGASLLAPTPLSPAKCCFTRR